MKESRIARRSYTGFDANLLLISSEWIVGPLFKADNSIKYKMRVAMRIDGLRLLLVFAATNVLPLICEVIKLHSSSCHGQG